MVKMMRVTLREPIAEATADFFPSCTLTVVMMLLPTIVTWMSMEGHRRLEQVIPDSVQKWWDKWELRGLVLISLVTQIILIILGDRRKWKPNNLTRALLWSAYLLADWVAAVAMGVISSNLGDIYNKGEQPKNVDPQLLAFWATFFLIHLGGPDTITAYSLEDNELWLRHFVGFLSQSTLTVYVIILSWQGNWLLHLTIPMLIVGIIKYGEKTWSLYCGTIKYLRDSFLGSSDSSRNREQEESESNFLKEFEKAFLRATYIFISLFADMVLSPRDITEDRDHFLIENSAKWSLVDSELKLMYDVFYTKAFANYGIRGLISRFITLTTIIVVLVLYACLSEKNEHLDLDHVITYLLVIGALLADIYAFTLVLISDWTAKYVGMAALGGNAFYQVIYVLVYLARQHFVQKEVVTIGMGQCNIFNPVKKLEELPSVTYCLSLDDLKKAIFNSFFKSLGHKSEEGAQSNPSGSPGYRNLLLGKNVPIFASELELHRTIITWHIATDMFYDCDGNSNSKLETRENCKVMSDYMFYLLVKQRQMLPVGAGLITLQDTVIEAKTNVFPQDSLSQMSKKLLQHDTTRARDKASEMQSTSVLFHACAVAKQLIAEENRQQTWEFVEELWIEMMRYASAQCRVDMHAHQLRRHPEFLSHVWLYQAHLGLLDQFQITPRQTSV